MSYGKSKGKFRKGYRMPLSGNFGPDPRDKAPQPPREQVFCPNCNSNQYFAYRLDDVLHRHCHACRFDSRIGAVQPVVEHQEPARYRSKCE